MALPSFHNVLFPEDISYGSSGGPGFNTTIIELANGSEQRNVNWSQQRATYDVSHGVKSREQMEELIDFFTARRGRAYGFRFKDWMDYEMPRQAIGNATPGGAANLQVYKRYEPGTPYYFDRPITKIVPGSATVWVNGDPWGTPYLNTDNGIVYISGGAQAFPPNALIEVACEFHVPVRFDIDDMKVTHDDWEQMSWPSIPLVEIKAVNL